MGQIVIQVTKQAQNIIEAETRKANTMRIRRGEPMVKVTDVLAALEANWKETLAGLVSADAYVLAVVKQNNETGVKLEIQMVGHIAALETEPETAPEVAVSVEGEAEPDYPTIGHSIVEGDKASAE